MDRNISIADNIQSIFHSKYKWKLSRFFEICSWQKFKVRTFMLLIQIPEMFMSGSLWAGFGYACACNVDSVDYFFSTGFGSGVGAFFGHLLTSFTFSDNNYPVIPRIEIFHAIAYFFAILMGSGTTWQRIVNDTKDYGMTFTESFFFMWSMSFLLFLTIITVLRIINLQVVNFCSVEQFYFDSVKVKKRFLFDLQLSISIGLADAFFVGTETGYYTDNWLGGVFGIKSSTHVGVGMLKSGLATTLGFVVSQLVQNVISKDNWIDHLVDEPEPDTLLHRLSDLTLYVVPEPPITRQSFVGRMSLSAMASFKEQAAGVASPRAGPLPTSPRPPPGSRPGSMSFRQHAMPSTSVDSQSCGPDGSITPFAGMSFASHSAPMEILSPLQNVTVVTDTPSDADSKTQDDHNPV